VIKASCVHCGNECRKTDGKEIYPHRKDLHSLVFFKCDPCDARVGAHKNSGKPLGYAANSETQRARSYVHSILDPIWKKARTRSARSVVYKYLSQKMGIDRKKTHVGMFDIEQCRQAWRHLKGQNIRSIREAIGEEWHGKP
jgi:hypothetical protein